MKSTLGVLARTVLLAAAVAMVDFFLPRLLPGSPLASSELAPLPMSAQQELRQRYGLDRPLAQQFADYVTGLLRGDLGRSLATHRPVADLLRERLPWTVLLVGLSWSCGMLLGASLGTVSAIRPGGWTARVWARTSVALAAIPEFVMAMLLVVVFSVRWPLFPAGGVPWASEVGPGPLHGVTEVLRRLVLPTVALTVSATSLFTLASRNLLVGVLAEPFLLVARAKGLAPRRVLTHAWRCVLPAFLVLAGLRLATLVTGAVAVERVFNYPGLGSLLFDAVVRRDYPVIQGVFLVGSWLALAASAGAEVLGRWADPRLR